MYEERICVNDRSVLINAIQPISEKDLASALRVADKDLREDIESILHPKRSRPLYEQEKQILNFDKSIDKKNYQKLMESIERAKIEIAELEKLPRVTLTGQEALDELDKTFRELEEEDAEEERKFQEN